MKVYIKAVSIEDLRKQYPDMEEHDFAQLVDVDPTANYASKKRGKFMPWIFKQNKLGNLTNPDIYHDVTDALLLLEKDRKAFPKPDLNQYKTVDEFIDAYHIALNNPTPLSKRQKERETHKKVKQALVDDSNGEIEFLASDGDWELYTPKTFAGSIALAEVGCDKTKPYKYPEASDDNLKARWCTAANEGYYNRYTRQGPLYIFINRNDPINKFQSCPASGDWWFDKQDRSLGQDKFLEFCEAHPAIKQYFDIEERGGILYMGQKCLGFVPGIKEITLPDDFRWGSMQIPRDIESLYIPDGVKISNDGWYRTRLNNMPNLKTVRLPETMTELPDSFFSECVALEEITIPNSVKIYYERAFMGCTSLTTINHSENLIVVREGCFQGCTKLKSQLPASVKYIGKYVFNDCKELDPIQMPDSTTEIISAAFKSQAINGIELNNVTKVNSSAFYKSDISYIDISKLTYIGGSAFRDCPNLQVVEFNPDGVKVGSYAFADNDMDGLVTVKDSTELGLSVFDNCPNLTIEWDKADEPYEFENVKLIICSKDCKELISVNKGYIPIEIKEDGTRYEVE